MNPISENQSTALALSNTERMFSLKNKLETFQLQSINELKTDIAIKKSELAISLATISGNECPIKTKEYYISLFNTTDVEQTFKAVYNDFKFVTKVSGNAIHTNFNISMSILDLLKKLANYELDLYNIIDESELTSAELAGLFRDVLKENETTDETVIQLFEQAKKRAFLLRDRIEALRLEFENELNSKIDSITQQNKESISKTNNRIDGLESKSGGTNKKIKTWIILGSVLTLALSLVGSFLIHHYL